MRWNLIVLVALLIFSGCTQLIGDYVTESYEPGLDYSDPATRALFDPNYFPACLEGTCTALVCRNVTTGILSFLDFGITSLAGGECFFEDDFNETRFDAVQQTGDLAVREFMLGQGPTFVDFDEANRFCAQGLDMAVKWLYARPGSEYPLPASSRATCYLERNVVPLYVLYSEGQSVSVERARQIAEAFQGAGPVILVSEMDFDSSDDEIYTNVTEQLKAMSDACSNCLIAYGVRMGDYRALQRFNESVTRGDTQLNDSVDLIAFGINSHYSRQGCVAEDLDIPNKLVGRMYLNEVFPFLRTIRYNYSKPSIIPYVLFDTGPNGVPPGDTRYCVWNELQVAEAQRYFFDTALPVLAGYGAIGAAPYAYYDWENPLNCNDCQLLEQRDPATGDPVETPRFLNWFAFCHNYKAGPDRIPNSDLLAVHATQPGTVCKVAQTNLQFYQGSRTNATVYQKTQYGLRMQLPTYQPGEESNVQYFACEACVNEREEFPFLLPVAPSVPGDYCRQDDVWAELDRWAEFRDLDPMLVRAVAWQESSFDNCAVSVVSNRSACNPLGLDNNLNTPWNPPAGYSGPEPGIDDEPALGCSLRIPPVGQKYCAYGMMQSIEYPGYIYDELGLDFPDIYQQCAAEMRLPNGAREINPFNATHSACLGTLKLQRNLIEGANDVNSNDVVLNVSGTTAEDEAKRTALAAYFALHRYFGDIPWVQGRIPEFWFQRQLDSVDCFVGEGETPPAVCQEPFTPVEIQQRRWYHLCVGNEDFIDYIWECRIYQHPNRGDIGFSGNDYGAEVLAKYEALRQTPSCQSNCPPTRHLQEYLRREGLPGDLPP